MMNEVFANVFFIWNQVSNPFQGHVEGFIIDNQAWYSSFYLNRFVDIESYITLWKSRF